MARMRMISVGPNLPMICLFFVVRGAKLKQI